MTLGHSPGAAKLNSLGMLLALHLAMNLLSLTPDWHLIARMALPTLLYAMAAWFVAKAVKTFIK